MCVCVGKPSIKSQYIQLGNCFLFYFKAQESHALAKESKQSVDEIIDNANVTTQSTWNQTKSAASDAGKQTNS